MLRMRRPLIVAAHLLLIPFAYLMAFGLRFDFPLPEQRLHLFLVTVPVLLAIRLVVFWRFQLYEGWWRNAGMQDLSDILKAVSISSLLFLGCVFLVGNY